MLLKCELETCLWNALKVNASATHDLLAYFYHGDFLAVEKRQQNVGPQTKLLTKIQTEGKGRQKWRSYFCPSKGYKKRHQKISNLIWTHKGSGAEKSWPKVVALAFTISAFQRNISNSFFGSTLNLQQ